MRESNDVVSVMKLELFTILVAIECARCSEILRNVTESYITWLGKRNPQQFRTPGFLFPQAVAEGYRKGD